jgi:hypothetical protein
VTRPASPPDRRVVGLIAILVAIVLAINLISALVSGVDAALASLPIVVGLLVVGTVWVLLRALRR